MGGVENEEAFYSPGFFRFPINGADRGRALLFPLLLRPVSPLRVWSAVRRSEPIRSLLRAAHDALPALSRSVWVLSVLERACGHRAARAPAPGEVAQSAL